VSTIADVAENLHTLNQGKGTAGGENEVDAGGARASRGIRAAVGGLQRGVHQGGVQVCPGTRGSQELREQGTRGASASRKVTIREDGAIEVPKEEGGLL
jgi:hypothetical protein